MEKLTKERVRFTRHALTRAVDMGVNDGQLWRALTDPEQTYPQPKYGSRVYQREGIGVVVKSQDGHEVVLTVVWQNDLRWQADAERAPLPSGRYVPNTPRPRKKSRARH